MLQNLTKTTQKESVTMSKAHKTYAKSRESKKSTLVANVPSRGNLGSSQLNAILSHTDDLLKELQKSVNTNYNKEKEDYKKQKKLVSV